MIAPEDDLELLNNEGETADEAKFASFFLGPTYRAVRDLAWATATVITCMCVAALIFTYTERKWDILNSEIGEGDWDKTYIDTLKYRELKRVHDFVEDKLHGVKEDMDDFKEMATQLCFLKRDVYDYVWHVGGAVDYVISVLTTAGWGVQIPRTVGGKIVTVIYFLCGLPLVLMFLYSLIRLIDSLFTAMRAAFVDRIRSHESNPDGWALYAVSAILFALLLLVTLVSAGISTRRESQFDRAGGDLVPSWADNGKQHWLYWDAFYFQVISMLTIGFGDFHHKAYDASFGACQFFFVFIPICIFIALLKTTINQFRDSRVNRPDNVAGHQ